MITEEQALTIALQYIVDRGRTYDKLCPLFIDENNDITRGKFKNTKRDVFVLPYEIEGYLDPISFFVVVDIETGEVLYTRSAHGCVEDREE